MKRIILLVLPFVFLLTLNGLSQVSILSDSLSGLVVSDLALHFEGDK